MFFVVSTGRCGSMSLARILDQHPLCRCAHEPHPILIKLAAEWQHGLVSVGELRQYLAFKGNRLFPHRVGLRLYGESDQKLSFIIPFLAEFGTNTKFIWLIRDGRDVVSSMVTRSRVYVDHSTAVSPSLWHKYRIRGDRCGDVRPETWQSMTGFAKSCWYWSYTNRTIAESLADVGESTSMLVRLENLADALPSLLEFLDLPFYPLTMVSANVSKTLVRGFEAWTRNERNAFERWCGPEMDRWYPDWRRQGVPVAGPATVRSRTGEAVQAIRSHVAWAAGKVFHRTVRALGSAPSG